MPAAATTCAVCRRQRTSGSRDGSGKVFICVGCQADAKQFIAIQEAVWNSSHDTHDMTQETPHDDQVPERP